MSLEKFIRRKHASEQIAEHVTNGANAPALDSESCGSCGFADYEEPRSLEPVDFVRKNCGKPVSLLPQRQMVPDFPLEALGEALGEAAERMAYYVQVSPGMAGQSVLAAAALLAQGHIQVKRGAIGTGPVSLYCLTVAESGDRKSSLDRVALKPVRDFEDRRRAGLEAEKRSYRAKLQAFEQRRNSIINAAKGSGKHAMSEAQEKRLELDLEDHDQSLPLPPQHCNITFEEPTSEGIVKHFRLGLPSAGLFSDEGISFFSGHGMTAESRGRTIGMLAQLHDGKPITRTRSADNESLVLGGRRLSAHLMLQPVVAGQILEDPLLDGQGFLARFLISHEASMAGQRFLAGRDSTLGPATDPAVRRYWQRMTEIIDTPLSCNEAGELQLNTLELTGEALAAWVRLHDGIERQVAPDGRYAAIKPFAAKAAEHAARIAAVLAHFEDYQEVTAEHVYRSAALATYYLESLRIRAAESMEDQHLYEAGDLFEWLKAHGNGIRAEDFNRLPARMRRSSIARRLLGMLASLGHVRVTDVGRSGKPRAWEVDQHD